MGRIYYTGVVHCHSKWNCYYIPIIVIYSALFCLTFWLAVQSALDRAKREENERRLRPRYRIYSFNLTHSRTPPGQAHLSHQQTGDSESSSRRCSPRRCLHDDVLGWFLRYFLVPFILALFWLPLAVGWFLKELGQCIAYEVKEMPEKKRQYQDEGRRVTCCGIPLWRTKANTRSTAVLAEHDVEVASLGLGAEERARDPVIHEPLPTFDHSQRPKMYN